MDFGSSICGLQSEREIMSRSTIDLLIAASQLEGAIKILALTKGNNKKLIAALQAAAAALNEYVNQITL